MFQSARVKLDFKYLYWASVFALLLFLRASHYLDSDEGVILEGAWNLINGKRLYFDFFEFIPPGGFYAVFWIWKIFGVNYSAAKLAGIITVFLSSVGVYKISRHIVKSKFAYISSFAFAISSVFWPIINHNTFNILFVVWAVYFFLEGLSGYEKKYFVFGGLLAGASILFLQQRGIALLAAVSLFFAVLFFKEKKYLILKSAFCYLLSALSVLSLLAIKWPLQSLYQNLILFPLFNYGAVNKIPFDLFFVYAFALSLTALLLRRQKNKKVWGLVFIQFFLLLSAVTRPDIHHISLVIFPLYPLFFLAYDSSKRKFRASAYSFLGAVIMAPILASAFTYIYVFPPFYSIKNSAALSYVQKNCAESDYIYAGPFMPGMYFEAKKLNPAPYHSVLMLGGRTEKLREVKEALRKARPVCAALNYEMVKKFNYNKNNPVDNYISDNYKLVFRQNNTLIYKISK